MKEIQEFITLSPDELYDYAKKSKDEGYRLAQICATDLTDSIELIYSFGLDYTFNNVKLTIDRDTEIESISSIYEPAFLYENEMNDLFGIKINNILLDFGGQLYKLSAKAPFSNPPIKEDESNE